ncbi:MAG TPA: recombinase family protein [Verrucomicrobiae bacterium]|nr:recombinase family protein [Verrucomicrobiae bacterium]
MKIALYLRVSSDKQETANQARELRQFAAKQDWQINRVYEDHESGGKSDRAALKEMLRDASRRKFDLLLFWSLDRLSREGVLPTLRYLETLTGYGVQWRSFTEQFFDSCGPFRDAVVSILATLAKQERIRISERTKAGLAVARAKGKILGRPKTLRVTPRDVRKLRASGHSFRVTAAKLGISVGSVQRLAAVS